MKYKKNVFTIAVFGLLCFHSAIAQVTQKWYLAKTNTLPPMNFELVKKKEAYFLKTIFEDKSSATDAVTLRKKGSKTILEYKKKGDYNGEYHVIEPDGHLGLYNKEGKRFGLATFKK